jgi:hypothetical protein
MPSVSAAGVLNHAPLEGVEYDPPAADSKEYDPSGVRRRGDGLPLGGSTIRGTLFIIMMVLL